MAQSIAKATVEDKEFLDKLKKLCRNLDKKSIECVYRIISRLRRSYIHKTDFCDNLNTEEILELERLKNEFYANIYEISDDIYFYDGYFLPINHFEVSVFWHKHHLNAFKTFHKIKQKDVIDVGGFVGDSALIFEKYTEKNIYSFEATKSNFDLMLKSLKLNDSKRIIPINKGLGSSQTTMKISLQGAASSVIYNSSDKYEEIEIITLDSFVEKHNIEVGLIKVDIEGFEMEFLKGAKTTIEKQKPAMIISIYHQASDFFDIKPLIESWNLGYTFQIIKPFDNYSHVSVETALYCEVLD
ncbi:MAG: FkbM family methyltransferase [Helicobacteraceae bacterium]|nr:FkbM family methyltransferase [Helicobacteraceae bacterium]